MSSLNKAMLIGNLAEDPKLNYTASGTAVCNLRLITNSKYKSGDEWVEKAEGHNVVLWGKLAELASQYLGKGRKVYVEGELQTRSYDDKNGVKRYQTEINAREMQFLDYAKDSDNQSNGRPTTSKPATQTDRVSDKFDLDDDDLPF